MSSVEQRIVYKGWAATPGLLATQPPNASKSKMWLKDALAHGLFEFLSERRRNLVQLLRLCMA